MGDVVLLTLEEYEHQIAHRLEQGAAMIFYQHRLEQFDWMTAEDQPQFKRELRLIRRQLREGVSITEVIAAEPLIINGTTLYTMLLKCDVACHPYSLLRQRGMLDDADYTPYFFTSEKTRNGAVRYINIPP